MRANFNPPAAREQHRYIATAGAFLCLSLKENPPPKGEGETLLRNHYRVQNTKNLNNI